MKQRIVIKLGGSSLNNPATLHELTEAVRGYRKRRYDVVLVHGGGPAINQELTRRGIEWRFINGQRQTTPQMIGVIEEVLAGQINPMIVQALVDAGIPSVGLSGARDGILYCTQASPELLQVGSVEAVETASIESALTLKGMPVPVIAPIGFGAEDNKFNVNADWAAAKIAIALGARKLVFLTDQNGILDQDKQLVRRARPSVIQKMIDEGVISGGMYTKVSAMMAALSSGVGHVRVLNAAFASQIHGRFKTGTLLKDEQMQKDVLHEHAS